MEMFLGDAMVPNSERMRGLPMDAAASWCASIHRCGKEASVVANSSIR